jgi:hypothetical protein
LICGSATTPTVAAVATLETRGRREDSAGADVGVHQATGQPGQPFGDGIVDTRGNAGRRPAR